MARHLMGGRALNTYGRNMAAMPIFGSSLFAVDLSLLSDP